MKKGLIFDWDGTLFDSAAYKRSNFVDLLSGEGLPAVDLQIYHEREAGIPRRKLFGNAFLNLGAGHLTDERFAVLSARYTEMNLQSSLAAAVFPDAMDFLERLPRDVMLFVSSSSAHDELNTVVPQKLPRIPFIEILGSRPGSNKGPEHVAHICDHYHMFLDDLLMVGDDKMDEVLAREAKIDFVRIVREEEFPGAIRSLQQLSDRLNY